jgi:hypothetical protein
MCTVQANSNICHLVKLLKTALLLAFLPSRVYMNINMLSFKRLLAHFKMHTPFCSTLCVFYTLLCNPPPLVCIRKVAIIECRGGQILNSPCIC